MGRNHLLMIIDEDAERRAAVAEMVRSGPYAIAADCGYGVEAITLAAEARPQVILAAVDAPVARAIQTVKSLRLKEGAAPIIVYSGIGDVAQLRPVLQAGIADFLPLPFEARDLRRSIESVLADPEGGSLDDGSTAAGTIVTVVGAKGGVGKTTVATNLATAIAQGSAHHVLLMEMDTRFGDVAFMLDVDPRFTIADLAGNVDALDRQSFRTALATHASGVQVLAAPRHPLEWRNISGEKVRALVDYAARMFDFVILDTPGTFNENVAAAIDTANELLIVSSLDLPSLKDTIAMLELLGAEEGPREAAKLLLNDATNAQALGIRDVADVLQHPIEWTVPYDRAVAEAAQLGEPVVLTKPRSRAARSLTEVAEAITGGGMTPAQPGARGLRRLLPFSGKPEPTLQPMRTVA